MAPQAQAAEQWPHDMHDSPVTAALPLSIERFSKGHTFIQSPQPIQRPAFISTIF
jgi:hypothetical protein